VSRDPEYNTVKNVGAGLLAKAAGQSPYASQTHRFREQARSHRCFAVSGEPALENLFRAGNPLVQDNLKNWSAWENGVPQS